MGQFCSGADRTTVDFTAIPGLDRNDPSKRGWLLARCADGQARTGRGGLAAWCRPRGIVKRTLLQLRDCNLDRLRRYCTDRGRARGRRGGSGRRITYLWRGGREVRLTSAG